MDPRDALALLLDQLRDDLTYVAGGYEYHEIPDSFDRLIDLFAGVGICSLMADADSEAYRRGLGRSACVRRAYLRRACADGRVEDRRLAASRLEGWFAAMAGGFLPLAGEIAELTPEEWLRNREYEEDHCYALFLHHLARRAADPPAEMLSALLARFERALEGTPSFRLPVAKALLAADSGAFESSLRAFLEDENEKLDTKRPEVAPSNALFWCSAWISLEGLALLRLGELRGLHCRGELPRCPSESRLPPADQEPEDLIDRLIREAQRKESE